MPEQPSYPTQEKKGKFKSEFSMGLFDFERYHAILKTVDWLSFQVRRGSYAYMKDLYAALETLYANWSSIIVGTTKAKDIETLFEQLEVDIAKCERIMNQGNTLVVSSQKTSRFIVQTAQKIRKLHKEVMILKQYIGLGIQVRKEMSQRKMIKIGMRGVREELPRTDTEP